MKKLSLFILFTIIVLVSCDDSTGLLGSELMPAQDIVQPFETSYYATTRTVPAGNVLARSSVSYLGRFTDPETGTSIKSDFLAQFHCNDRTSMSDSLVGDTVKSVELRLLVSDYIGDSLQSLKVAVYPLDSVLNPDNDLYTDIDPTQYYDNTQQPLVEKWFSITDYGITDSARWDDDYRTQIHIPLPNKIGNDIIKAYRKDASILTDPAAFINSGLTGTKGFYFKLEAGDGAMAYMNYVQFNITYDGYSKSDSTVSTDKTCSFAATEEVVQATRFENSNLQKLIDDQSCTYLKSPAGLFTEITIPIDEFIASEHINDSINKVGLTLTRYNDKEQNTFKLDYPDDVLLVRVDEYANYFEKYKVADGRTSYIATFDNDDNTYEFANISGLINTMIGERQNGTYSPDYNKVYVIPVETTYDSSSNLVKVCHDFSMTSARLVGGTDKIKLDVVYTRY